jgi:serine/threonine-protein kinase
MSAAGTFFNTMGTDQDAPPPASERDPLAETAYRTLRPLGRGAMGEVVVAEHRRLRKEVVVKLLHERLIADAHYVDRMRVEAEALASLSSPHLVQVTDSSVTPAGRPFFVMELLHGVVLREELRARGAFAIPDALEITRQILVGLSVVHDARLVHRDVKLENIFYCDDQGRRTVKLLDFGIVKVLPRGSGVEPLYKPTDAGVAMGTPRYFAPEQALGRPVDARSDLYSVGVVLYTLLAGRGPFDDHKGLPELIVAQVGERAAPPSRYATQQIPPSVDELVLRALEKSPDARYASASDFLFSIARCQQEFAGSRATTTPRAADPPADDSVSTLPKPQPEARWPATERLPPDAAAQARAPRGRFGTEAMPHVQAAELARRVSARQEALAASQPSQTEKLDDRIAPRATAPSVPATAVVPHGRRVPRALVIILIAVGVLVGVVLTLALLRGADG